MRQVWVKISKKSDSGRKGRLTRNVMCYQTNRYFKSFPAYSSQNFNSRTVNFVYCRINIFKVHSSREV